jgi:hypothetical protein
MNSFTLRAILAASVFALAAPIAAPIAAQPPAGWDKEAFWAGAPVDIWERVGFMQQRIDRNIAHHHLNHTESARAQNELQRIREMTGQMRERDGGTLSDTDRTYLQDRLDQLGSSIHWMSHN